VRKRSGPEDRTASGGGLLGELPAEGRLVVALSGGRDSVVLLHILRFGGIARGRLVAVHVDHGMRSCSAGDAAWVRGLCRAWQVALVEARLLEAPTSELEARNARWRVLDEVREATGAVGVVTAHHADDQAETVLHHVARGTGLRGLRGIPREADARLRPLLEVEGAAIEALALRLGIRWREDPSNRDPSWTRNRIRHRVLPALEEAVPGARRALLRLARVARQEEAALMEATRRILDDVRTSAEPGLQRLDAAALEALGPGLRARVLRRSARELGAPLDARGTRAALAFTTGSRSGSERHLTGGLILSRELDHFVLRASGGEGRAAKERGVATVGVRSSPDLRPPLLLRVGMEESGEAPIVLPEGPGRVAWGPATSPEEAATRDGWRAALDIEVVGGPLLLRPWRPGDRIEMRYGTKKLKKLLVEARLDRERRRGHPVLEDADGRIVWVPGIPDAVTPAARGATLHIRILHDARR
jgi:tRNA(Ile)-lysidine synthase